MKTLIIFLSIISMVYFGKNALAATYYIPDDFSSIQSAIDGVSNNDTIFVRPGTYKENVSIVSKSITLQSTDGSGVTTIDGGGIKSTVYIFNAERVSISGFTIKNGFSFDGGGLHIEADGSGLISNITLSKNIVSGNFADWGGGISCAAYNSAAITFNLTYNEINNNHSYESGGGIAFNSEASGKVTTIFEENSISDNRADGHGGGMYINPYGAGTTVDFASSGDILNTNFSLGSGGAIAAYSGDEAKLSLNMSDSTISNNIARGSGGGIYLYPVDSQAAVTLSKSKFVENEANGGSGGGILLYDGNSDPAVILNENTFSRNASDAQGGGAWFYFQSSPSSFEISKNTFTENTCFGANNMQGGNGIYIGIETTDFIGKVEGNRIVDNYAGVDGVFGGGVRLENGGDSTLLVQNNIISRNTAHARYGGDTYGYGGGIHITNSGSLNIDFFNNTISGNVAPSGGGGLYVSSSSGIADFTFVNDIIFANSSSIGPGQDVWNFKNASSIAFSYSDVGDVYGIYSDGGGNISADPLFADIGNADYHLTENSPAVDSGTSVSAPDTDIEEYMRPQGSGHDMGAHEYLVCGDDVITINSVTIDKLDLYYACIRIQAGETGPVVVEKSGELRVRAGEEIILYSGDGITGGFRVENGGIFRATVDSKP